MPPSAAITGAAAARGSLSEPALISRRISSPTIKKKIASSPSDAQSATLSDIAPPIGPIATWAPMLPQRLGGKDLFWWLTRLRLMHVAVDSRLGRVRPIRDPAREDVDGRTLPHERLRELAHMARQPALDHRRVLPGEEQHAIGHGADPISRDTERPAPPFAVRGTA